MLIALLSLVLQAQETDPARRALERSLPYLEKEGVAWIRRRACLSCHHVPFLLWSFREARDRGLAVDPKKLAEWTEWSRNESMAQRVKVKLAEPALESLPADTRAKLAPLVKKGGVKEEEFLKELAKSLSAEELASHQDGLRKNASREKGDGGGLDAMAQLLLGNGYGPDDAFRASTRDRIAELLQADGSWKPGGQLFGLMRTAAEATEVTTMWTMLALEPSEVVTKALAVVKKAKTGVTNEWLAARMMVEKKFGEPGPFQGYLQELLARQNADGGWAWLQGSASDAFATGQVLYALSFAGSIDAAVIVKARRFLVETQGEDGSWKIDGLSAKPRPSKEPIYRYWGTAWAAIGLARTLPDKP